MGGEDKRAVEISGGCVVAMGGVVVRGIGGVGWDLAWVLDVQRKEAAR